MSTELPIQSTPTVNFFGKRTCPRCGSGFVCGIASGDSTCWCFSLPHVINLQGEGSGSASACLCPDCLRLQIHRNMGFVDIY